MEFKFNGSAANQKTILDHPAGLFVLFFTEMWERFSYYGMRALLVLFLTASLLNEGWGWERADALTLYGFYTGLVYLTPIIGGFLADKFFGFRKAVVIGALIMTLGHAAMAIETVSFTYLGLALLILGNGLFKPNISSIVGNLYKSQGKEKDAGYTIFYMGINAGAFLGILLCGYLGEKFGWNYGFGLAGIFMFLGMLQFFFVQKIFGRIGLSPQGTQDFDDAVEDSLEETEDAIEDVVEEAKKNKISRDRIIVIGVLAFFTIFFWMAFEQAGGSMTIFAGDYTDRVLTGGAASAFTIINTVLVIVPLIIVTWVLAMLCKQIMKDYPLSSIMLIASFITIWAIAIFVIKNDFDTKSYQVSYVDDNGNSRVTKILTTQDFEIGSQTGISVGSGLDLYFADDKKNESNIQNGNYIVNAKNDSIGMIRKGVITKFEARSKKGLFWKDAEYAIVEYTDAKGVKQSTDIFLGDTYLKEGEYNELSDEEKKENKLMKVGNPYNLLLAQGVGFSEESATKGTLTKINENEVEIGASWFGILNSFFIIAFAPVFSRIWESKMNPSGPVKFAIGLILLGIGFGALAYGSMDIPQGAKTASVSILWLILAYLFHTLGELCVSPVGLSYVSKLAPVKLMSLMFGIWFVANFIANTLAGLSGSFIDSISEQYGLSTFFMIFTLLPIGAGIIMLLIKPILIKKMHGIT
ncbi:oligopeptide:H+ symporter [uncultured Nonlabens sp.]|uniref:peptide MFS transporter n=1 Tax=uncultured Nonlabens sp. TaxID=859306 RepID=UPI0026146AE0|nr:oligopeptide:H+ symporter [uncultured Nonlabens sp.]